MDNNLIIDFIRFTHFVGLALGIGAGSFADWSILKKLGKKITIADLNMLEGIHRHVWFGLALLWISGITLLYIRTGLAFAEFSPKLIAKLSVVTILTVNAVLMGFFAIPILRKNTEKSYIAFPLQDKSILGIMAAVSICSWLSGLILGIFSALKFAEFSTILPLFLTLYATVILLAATAVISLHLIWNRKRVEIATLANDHTLVASTTVFGQVNTRITSPNNSVDIHHQKTI